MLYHPSPGNYWLRRLNSQTYCDCQVLEVVLDFLHSFSSIFHSQRSTWIQHRGSSTLCSNTLGPESWGMDRVHRHDEPSLLRVGLSYLGIFTGPTPWCAVRFEANTEGRPKAGEVVSASKALAHLRTGQAVRL